MNTQLDILKNLGLGKKLSKKEITRKKWSLTDDAAVVDAFNRGATDLELASLAVEIDKPLASVKMKILNIQSIIKGDQSGMSHTSSQLIDCVMKRR